jgi:hypothetical protein
MEVVMSEEIVPTNDPTVKPSMAWLYGKGEQQPAQSEHVDPPTDPFAERMKKNPTLAKAIRNAREQGMSDEQIAARVEEIDAGKAKRRKAMSEGYETLDSLVKKWVYVEREEVFVARERDSENNLTIYKVSAFDRAFNRVRYNKKLGKISQVLLDIETYHTDRRMPRFKTFAFAPGRPENNGGNLNLWKPSDIKPIECDFLFDDENAWFHRHLEYLLPDEDERREVWLWLCWVFQNQDKHPHVALMIHGLRTGTGKSYLRHVMRRLLGDANYFPITQKMLERNFDNWKVYTKLLGIEEVRPGGSINNSIIRNLHDLISEDQMPVEIKGKDVFKMANYLAIMASSNEDNALEIEDDQRRWLIVSCDRAGILEPKPDAYYAGLYAKLADNEAMSKLAYEMKSVNLAGYTGCMRAANTTSKKDMSAKAASGIERHMVECRDEPPYRFQYVTLQEIKDDLHTHVLEATRRSKDLDYEITRVLRRKFGGEKIGQVRLGSRRPQLWIINKPEGWERPSEGDIAKAYERERSATPPATKASALDGVEGDAF